MTENGSQFLRYVGNWTSHDNNSSGPEENISPDELLGQNWTLEIISSDESLGQNWTVTVFLSLLFFVVGVVGICGNSLVIFAVIFNKKMRTSMTNLLITNLAFADLVIMMFGIPETIQFMMRRGWVLEQLPCKINRYILVAALYGSVLTLIALCVERQKHCLCSSVTSSIWRYVAIIHPIKAHILCNKRRIVVVLGCIWPCAWLAGLPTLIFNDVGPGHPDIPVVYCMITFPNNHFLYFKIFKYIESVLFYFIPLGIQLTLYVFISKHLFLGSDRLHRRVTIRNVNGSSLQRFSEALQARRGVVKMLMLSVIVYFISYSPNQILLICNTISPTTFHENFSYQVFTMIVANINSAANPVLYSIFSQNFRQCFKYIMCSCCVAKPRPKPRPRERPTLSNGSRFWRHTSLASASTEV